MQVYLINGHEHKAVQINNELDDYYKLLECRCFTIVNRVVGGVAFDIYCDDEGLLKENPRVSAVYADFEPHLFGNLVITHTNDEGETIGITDDDVKILESHLVFGMYQNRAEIDESCFFPVLLLDDEE